MPFPAHHTRLEIPPRAEHGEPCKVDGNRKMSIVLRRAGPRDTSNLKYNDKGIATGCDSRSPAGAGIFAGRLRRPRQTCRLYPVRGVEALNTALVRDKGSPANGATNEIIWRLRAEFITFFQSAGGIYRVERGSRPPC